MAPPTTILVTGANVGLGYECIKQLAKKEGVKKVILGCRNPAKAQDAKERLEAETGLSGTFETLQIDVSDLDSVQKAVVDLLKEPIDGLVMNAGGMGGPEPDAKNKNGVSNLVAVNLLGHAHLVDLLLQNGKLKTGSSVIYSGSEAATMGKPMKSGSVDEFVSHLDGSAVKGFYAYGSAKLVAAYWMASMARKHSSIRFITISPGGTKGTAIFGDAPFFIKLMMPIMQTFMMHSVEKGAMRYVDPMFDEETYQSGVFYASKSGATGPVMDYSVQKIPSLSNEEYQDNAYTALHKFLP